MPSYMKHKRMRGIDQAHPVFNQIQEEPISYIIAFFEIVLYYSDYVRDVVRNLDKKNILRSYEVYD